MAEKMPGAIVNFPALLTTEMSADRSTNVLQYLLVSTKVALHKDNALTFRSHATA